MAPTKIKLDAYGRMLLAEHTERGWVLFDLGSDGKHRRATDIVVPAFIGADEIDTFIGDLLHEMATRRHPSVIRVPLDVST